MKLIATALTILLCGGLYPHIYAKPRRMKLSDVDHHADTPEHDTRYDHEAFLGKEEAEKFEKLTPEESREKLGQLFDKIDLSLDGYVSSNELSAWIERVQRVHMEKEASKDFTSHGGKDDRLPYEVYLKEAYIDDDLVVPEHREVNRKKIAKDKLKWDVADQDKDGLLSLEEFTAYANPLEFPHMHDVYIEGIFMELDMDGDGTVTHDEFGQSRWKPTTENEETPQWVIEEMDLMKTFDKNLDGNYDIGEIRNWLIPPGHNPITAEMVHLMEHADDDRDEKLSKAEVLKHQDLFVGSQATAFGNVWDYHEEL